jgi:hypothetical protein
LCALTWYNSDKLAASDKYDGSRRNGIFRYCLWKVSERLKSLALTAFRKPPGKSPSSGKADFFMKRRSDFRAGNFFLSILKRSRIPHRLTIATFNQRVPVKVARTLFASINRIFTDF